MKEWCIEGAAVVRGVLNLVNDALHVQGVWKVIPSVGWRWSFRHLPLDTVAWTVAFTRPVPESHCLMRKCMRELRVGLDQNAPPDVLEADDESESVAEAPDDQNPYRNAPLLIMINKSFCRARVVGMDVGVQTGKRFFRIRYDDGDLQHLDEDELRRNMVNDDD